MLLVFRELAPETKSISDPCPRILKCGKCISPNPRSTSHISAIRTVFSIASGYDANSSIISRGDFTYRSAPRRRIACHSSRRVSVCIHASTS